MEAEGKLMEKDFKNFAGNIVEDNIFTTSLARENWKSKYQYGDESPLQTFVRVAKALASVEDDTEYWTGKFLDMMVKTEEVSPGKYRAIGLKNTFGGRITANAGTSYTGTTLYNCFINLPPQNATITYTQQFENGSYVDVTHNTGDSPDSLANIMLALMETALILKSEGGFGINFGWIRPRGSVINSLGIRHPGVVHYMTIWDKMSDVIVKGDSDGYQDLLKNYFNGNETPLITMKKQARKGAMLAALPVWHPDIEEFVRAKQQPGVLTKFNVSVVMDDRFMEAVKADDFYDLWFPEDTGYTLSGDDIQAGFVDIVDGKMVVGDKYTLDALSEAHDSRADYFVAPYGKVYTKKVYKRVKAVDLYNLIMESTYNRAEPGVLYYDSMQRNNPLSYINSVSSSNPCLVEGTLVATESGLRPVESVKVGDKIQTTLGFAPVKAAERHEDTKAYRVTFSDGSHVDATAAHIFHSRRRQTESRKRWNKDTRLDQLNVGDFVRKDYYRFSAENSPELSRDMGLLYGLYLGDGNTREESTAFRIAIDLREDSSYITDLLTRLGFTHRVDVATDGSNSGYIYVTPYREVIGLFAKYNLSLDKDNIDVASVINTNREFAYGVLDGLISSDGNVNLKSRYPQIRFKNTKQSLHLLIRHLFLLVGADYKQYVAGNVGEETVISGRTITRTLDLHEGIIDNDSILNFYRHIEYLSHPGKQRKLEEIVSSTTLSGVKWATQIVSVEELPGTYTVYDLYESHADDWLAGGIVHRGCGEIPGFVTVCLLGNVNLTQYVLPNRKFDWETYEADVATFARALDNVNDVEKNLLPQFMWAKDNVRQYGMGINGLGSTLIMMGIPFNSPEGLAFTDEVAARKEEITWRTSAELAKEKGAFPGMTEEFYQTNWFKNYTRISKETKELMRKYGVRNGKTTTNAPNGNTSVITNNTSNGIEPVFMFEYTRTYIADRWPEGLTQENVRTILSEKTVGDATVWEGDYAGRRYYYEPHNRGLCIIEVVEDYGYAWVKKNFPEDLENADYLVTTEQLSVSDHVNSQLAIQRNINQSTSKTINLPNDYSFEDFKKVYMEGWEKGLVGMTTYRSGSMEAVLSKVEESQAEDVIDFSHVLTDGVKLPSTFVNGETHVIKRESGKYYIHFSYHPDDSTQMMPVAMWVNTNNTTPLRQVNAAVKEIVLLLEKAGINPDLIQDMQEKIKEDRDNNRLARAISMALRHNVPIALIVDALGRVDEVYVSDLLFAVKKFLSGFVKDGTKIAGMTCAVCGSSDIIYESGCSRCLSCGTSNCS